MKIFNWILSFFVGSSNQQVERVFVYDESLELTDEQIENAKIIYVK